MNKIKLGIIGCGNMAQWAHLPSFSVVESAQITNLYDPREEVGQNVCRKWDIPTYNSNLEDLLSTDIDAVCILTPVQCHKHQIIKALEAGKHVFTEKPLAMSAKSAKEIRDIAEKTGKFVMVGYMKQHEMNITEAIKAIKENDFGKPIFVRTHSFIGSSWHGCVDRLDKIIASEEALPPLNLDELDFGPESIDMPRDETFYSFDNPFFGLLDTGCHSINLLRHVTGMDYKLTSVNSKAGARIINFDFGEFMGISEFCVNFAMRKWDEVTELYFEKATIKIKTPPPTFKQANAEVEIYSENGLIQENKVLEINNEWSFLNQAEAFIKALQTNEFTTKYIDESIKDIDMMEQIFQVERQEPVKA